jgi:hypothetical protein
VGNLRHVTHVFPAVAGIATQGNDLLKFAKPPQKAAQALTNGKQFEILSVFGER